MGWALTHAFRCPGRSNFPSSLILNCLKIFFPIKQETMCNSLPTFLYLLWTYFTRSYLAVCQICVISDDLRSCQLRCYKAFGNQRVFSSYSPLGCVQLIALCMLLLGGRKVCVIDWILIRKMFKSKKREWLNAPSGFYGKHFMVSFNFVYWPKCTTSQAYFVQIQFVKYVLMHGSILMTFSKAFFFHFSNTIIGT